MPSIAGRYTTIKVENMEEHLAAFGLSYLIRKMASLASPVLEISINGDTMTIKTVTAIKTMDSTFKLGEVYEEELPDGVKMNCVTKIINDHEILTESEAPSTGLKTQRHYLFTDEGCVVTITTVGVAKPGIRHFKRAN